MPLTNLAILMFCIYVEEWSNVLSSLSERNTVPSFIGCYNKIK